MKKLLSIVLALVLALSLSVTALAEDTKISPDPNNEYKPNPESGSTSVSYTVNPAYTVTIPQNVTLEADNSGTITGSATVSASGVKVAKASQVVVKLTGTSETDDTFKVKTRESASLAYTVTAKGNVESSNAIETNVTISKDSPVLTVESGLNNEMDTDGTKTGASTGSTELTFALADDEVVQYAGTYTGTVTFKVSVVPIINQP